jgi:hypothetical protein
MSRHKPEVAFATNDSRREKIGKLSTSATFSACRTFGDYFCKVTLGAGKRASAYWFQVLPAMHGTMSGGFAAVQRPFRAPSSATKAFGSSRLGGVRKLINLAILIVKSLQFKNNICQ